MNDNPPRTCLRIGLVILQAFIEDFAVPFRHGRLLGSGGNSLPQRQDVRSLLVDRKVVNSLAEQKFLRLAMTWVEIVAG